MNHKINHLDLDSLHKSVSNHSLYKKIRTLSDLKIMMETHVFAVWDFMSLLKRLQRDITCVDIPWRPSPYPKALVRLINEIVLGEESDIDETGQAIDHFSLYLLAMKEVGASTNVLHDFLTNLNFSLLTPAQKNFVQFNLNLAKEGKIHEVAAAFFFGREKLIPDMFTNLLDNLEKNIDSNDQQSFKELRFYIKRHIEIDGNEHSHLAYECLSVLCADDPLKWEEARLSGKRSLELRSRLWDEVEAHLF